MSLSFTVDLKDSATARVAAAMEGLQARNVNPVAARAVVNATRAYLFKINSERPNKLGGRRTNFFAQAARGTHFELLPDGFTLGINQVGMRQRYQGGTITAKNVKYLTIPVAAQAYGKRAREFADLQFAIVPGVGKALVKATAQSFSRTRGINKESRSYFKPGAVTGGEVMYRLVPSVHQDADPTVLPSEAEFKRAMVEAVEGYWNRLIERRNQ